MYYDKYIPFYAAYAQAPLYEGEKAQEAEFALMKSYYPAAARRIQDKVEAECQLLDYEGSSLFDEYPDRLLLYRLGQKVRRDLEAEVSAQGMPGEFLEDLIQVLLCQEVSRRRCRRQRCRKYFQPGKRAW